MLFTFVQLLNSLDLLFVVLIFKQKDAIEFMAAELRKYFKVGEHVKIIGGRNEGETGLIVRVEDNVAIILSDLTMEEITVFQRFLQLCQATATGVDSLGHFEYGDLVQIE